MSGKTKKKIRWKEFLPYYLLALPGVIYMICNNYLPMFGVIIAFKNLNFRKGILGSDWCGLDNFKFLFASKDAFTITRNTILYNVAFIVLTTVLAIAIAILVNEIQSRFASRLYQSLILLPYLMSWVIVSYLVYAFLSAETGLVNNAILEKLGLKGISWYNSPQYWPFILTFVSLWKSLGYAMIIYFSSIVGISQDYYEAATLDRHHDVCATDRKNFLLRFRSVLSDPDEQRYPLQCDQNHRRLCIQRPDEEQRLWYVQCGQRLPVGCRLHHDHRRQRPDP